LCDLTVRFSFYNFDVDFFSVCLWLVLFHLLIVDLFPFTKWLHHFFLGGLRCSTLSPGLLQGYSGASSLFFLREMSTSRTQPLFTPRTFFRLSPSVFRKFKLARWIALPQIETPLPHAGVFPPTFHTLKMRVRGHYSPVKPCPPRKTNSVSCHVSPFVQENFGNVSPLSSDFSP